MTHPSERIGVCKGKCTLPPRGWGGPNSGSNPVSLLISDLELQAFHSQNGNNASVCKVVDKDESLRWAWRCSPIIPAI